MELAEREARREDTPEKNVVVNKWKHATCIEHE